MTKKLVRVFLPILLLYAFFVGCSSNAPVSMDTVDVESTLRQYYTAFNSHDMKCIEDVFTKRAWQEERASLRPLVYWAKNIGFKYGLPSIKSVEVKEDSVKVCAGVTSNLGSWDDYFYFIVEHGNWKIDRLITRDFSSTRSVDNTVEQIEPGAGATKPSCCQ